jgi:hypothetical protein
MRGLLIVFERNASRVEELLKDALHVGVDRENRLVVQHAGCISDPLAVLEWSEAQGTWILSATGGTSGPSVTLRTGGPVSQRLFLSDGDSLNIGSAVLTFRRLPAAPLFHGKPRAGDSVALVLRLCFGRGGRRIARRGCGHFDPEDRRISRRHLLPAPDKISWFAMRVPRDVSQRTAF